LSLAAAAAVGVRKTLGKWPKVAATANLSSSSSKLSSSSL